MNRFEDKWIYPTKVKHDMPLCTHYTVEPSDDKFKSGRPIDKVTFFAGNEIIEDRRGMTLISRRTNNPYVVCETKPWHRNYTPLDEMDD